MLLKVYTFKASSGKGSICFLSHTKLQSVAYNCALLYKWHSWSRRPLNNWRNGMKIAPGWSSSALHLIVIIELRFCSRGTKIPGNATLGGSREAPDSWRYIKSGGLKGLFREMFYGQIISTATCWLFPSVYTAALHRSMECQAQIHFTKIYCSNDD